jgi:uncharacterized protein (DUF302 family)
MINAGAGAGRGQGGTGSSATIAKFCNTDSNPHTATKMTRHLLAAGLYAPLRVILYEDETGGSILEYDRPSSLFGQYGDERVMEVRRYLDAALEAALRNAAE